jgi:hypothetical protein
VRARVAVVAVVAAIASGCGQTSTAERAPRFCGLVRTSSGFLPVSVRRGSVRCARARLAYRTWTCSRAMHATYELACARGRELVWFLERSPVRARVGGGVVRLADWEFRRRGDVVEGRRRGRWIALARPPYCVDAVPREVLVAWRLHALTPHGGCFRP